MDDWIDGRMDRWMEWWVDEQLGRWMSGMVGVDLIVIGLL